MIVVIGLLVAFALVIFANVTSGNTRNCRWREDRSARSAELTYWRCAVCGASEKTVAGRAPRTCRAPRS